MIEKIRIKQCNLNDLYVSIVHSIQWNWDLRQFFLIRASSEVYKKEKKQRRLKVNKRVRFCYHTVVYHSQPFDFSTFPHLLLPRSFLQLLFQIPFADIQQFRVHDRFWRNVI